MKYILQGFKQELANQIVIWHSDNTNVTRIIGNGSTKEYLQDIALDIHKACLQSDIQIIAKWIPREDNKIADSISKYRDTDDWSIDNETFSYIQSRFGKLDVDRFASSTNNKLQRFDARFHCPKAETINTFTAQGEMISIGYVHPLH